MSWTAHVCAARVVTAAHGSGLLAILAGAHQAGGAIPLRPLHVGACVAQRAHDLGVAVVSCSAERA
jgi:hypothetical protein